MMVYCSDRSMKLPRRKPRMIKRKPPIAKVRSSMPQPYRPAINNIPSAMERKMDEAIELATILEEWVNG